MQEQELLNAISKIMDSKLQELKANMATKDDLREVENGILSEVDRVQEKSNAHYSELKNEIYQLRLEVRAYNTDNLKLRVERLEEDMAEVKRKVS